MKFKKEISLVILSVFLLSNVISFAQSSENRIYINNKELALDAKPLMEKSRLLVPMRAIFEALGATVNWEPANKTVIGIKGDIKVVLKINSKDAYVNNKLVKLEVPAAIKSNRTFVPLRFVAESLDMDVSWNNTDKSVSINNASPSPTKSEVTPIPTPAIPTNTPIPTPTNTLIPTSTNTPTPTPIIPTYTPTPTLSSTDSSSDPLTTLYNRLSKSDKFSGITFDNSSVVHGLFHSDDNIATELYEVQTYRSFINYINDNFANASIIFPQSPTINNIKNMSSYLKNDCKFYKGDFGVVSEVSAGVVSYGAIYKATFILADRIDQNRQCEKFTYYVATCTDDKYRNWYIYDCELVSREKL